MGRCGTASTSTAQRGLRCCVHPRVAHAAQDQQPARCGQTRRQEHRAVAEPVSQQPASSGGAIANGARAALACPGGRRWRSSPPKPQDIEPVEIIDVGVDIAGSLGEYGQPGDEEKPHTSGAGDRKSAGFTTRDAGEDEA